MDNHKYWMGIAVGVKKHWRGRGKGEKGGREESGQHVWKKYTWPSQNMYIYKIYYIYIYVYVKIYVYARNIFESMYSFSIIIN